jgi:hypothetical protein
LLGLSFLCRGEVLFFDVVECGEEPFVLKMPHDLLGSGVNQITLFDAKGEIFAERLVFIMPAEQETIRIEAVPDKPAYQPEELIQIDFSLTGNLSKKEAVFSLSVRDEETMMQTNMGNILTNLLLSSDLKGFIENPEEYFLSENKSLQTRKLDLLMMVQGWKRYEWQTMAGIKAFKPLYKKEKQIVINGHIASSDVKNSEILMSMIDDKKQRMDGEMKTGNKGEFYIYPEDFYGTWTLNLRSPGLSDANTKIRLDRWFSPGLKNYSNNETIWKNNNKQEYRQEEIDDEPVIREIQLDNDSIGKQFRIKDIVKTAKNRQLKRKEFVHNVGMEIDKAIDMGKKIPFSVHDYLALNDNLYFFGKRVDYLEKFKDHGGKEGEE